MSPGKGVNLPASVHRRLLNISRETGTDPNYIWARYAMERLLYRLSVSDQATRFVLKGALLFTAWTGRAYRPTYDLDLLGSGEDSSDRMAAVFRKVCSLNVEPDGLAFDAQSVRVEPIREGQVYHGQRVSLVARLGKARIAVQVDVGFGDVITPGPVGIDFPTLLDFPAPRIHACTRETVVAEKFHVMTVLGIANSRMKDFHDIYVLSREFPFAGSVLAEAIGATFERRKTAVPSDAPMALTEDFGRNPAKTLQWAAFARKAGLSASFPALSELLPHMRAFLLPPAKAAAKAGPCPKRWPAGGPWE